MGKMKFVTGVFLLIGLISVCGAVEVINIDLNAYGDDTAYTGAAAYDDGINQWIPYYGGWGQPMGSPRSADLTFANDPAYPAGTYAAQVWIGDAGTGHTYVTGVGLMDDGFVADPLASGDPNVFLFGTGAYGGTFDVYVYGTGQFTLKSDAVMYQTSLSGNLPEGQFENGVNYFSYPGVLIDPNGLQIIYSDTLNAIQLVSVKQPTPITAGTIIDARNYSVAYDTNAREGEITRYGPDLGYRVHYLDATEYMEYDITVDSGNQGKYEIALGVTTTYGAISAQLSLDGILLGSVDTTDVQIPNTSDPALYFTGSVTVNLFAGSHTLKWKTPTDVYSDIADIRFTYLSPITMDNCQDVYTYGQNLAGDITGDCRVNMDDLALLAADWADCNDPNPENCL
jgi:hypothetical protein